MKKVYTNWLILCTICIYFFSGCSNQEQIKKEKSLFQRDFFLNEKVDFEIEITFKVFSGMERAKKTDVNIWASELIDRPNLKIDTVIYELNPPNRIEIENENFNKILYWHFSDFPPSSDTIIIKRIIKGSVFTYAPVILPEIVNAEWNEIPGAVLSFYTKEEPFLEQTDSIKMLAAKIIGNEVNPFFKAEKIFGWVNENMNYVYPPKNRGAKFACQSLSGDCGQYSNLFIALCRSAGIPARQQSGFTLKKDKTGSHVWSEVYFPYYGWTPVDATRKDGFCKISNDQITASVGMNIPLPDAPEWANYENSEIRNGRTDFMQTSTTAIRPDNITLSSEKKIIEYEKE